MDNWEGREGDKGFWEGVNGRVQVFGWCALADISKVSLCVGLFVPGEESVLKGWRDGKSRNVHQGLDAWTSAMVLAWAGDGGFLFTIRDCLGWMGVLMEDRIRP